MNEFQTTIQAIHMFETHENKEKCRCKGNGYFLSPFDSWEQCGYHWNKNTPHPEDEYNEIVPTTVNNDCERGEIINNSMEIPF